VSLKKRLRVVICCVYGLHPLAGLASVRAAWSRTYRSRTEIYRTLETGRTRNHNNQVMHHRPQ
jgi:hypothetical protein